jgi:hypothetical protein
MSGSFTDFNDADSFQGFGVIPDKSFAKLKMIFRPGDVLGPDPADGNILKKAKPPSDVKMLDCEFTVLNGPYAKRKLWQNLAVAGGKLDDKGVSMAWNISKSMIRSMIDSAWGLDPVDMSDTAKAKRRFSGFRELNGIEFAARIDIQHGNPVNPQDPGGAKYPDRNVIGAILTAKDPQYAAVMAGQPVESAYAAAAEQKNGSTAAPAAGAKPWASAPVQTATAAANTGTEVKKPAWMS